MKAPELEVHEAEDILSENFEFPRGLIRPKIIGYGPTDREGEIIAWLVSEWDYAYSPTGDF